MAENRIKTVIAKCNIKYDKDLYQEGDSFKVRKSDLKELIDRDLVDFIEEEVKGADENEPGAEQSEN
ncbi:hypothetical protein FDJ70_07605 [Clostridium botulinum]|uniref:DUF7210 family protein n=2 Tax=Clostridium TaxID=1485 RepID=UPI0013F822C1|nr:hypothetical protein [Clostridium botulinum]MCD3217481.1 hypothetical protein [Clostridium botulinum C]NFV47538.1 hypothetical protein [Clostridium botulinum]